MQPRTPSPGKLGTVVPIYCIYQPHYHALAGWYSRGQGKKWSTDMQPLRQQHR